MSLIDIGLTIILISVFCLGLRTLLSEGMIFRFILQPFVNKKEAGKHDWMLKPFILCVVCFPSFWGSIVFLAIHGLRWELLICIISATFIIKFVNDKVEF